jgi:hypothetical protein
VSLINYWFDSEFFQRRDIERGKEAQSLLGSQLDATSDDIASLRRRVTELSATVQVLMQVLHETHGLDIDALKAKMAAINAPKPAPCAKCGVMKAPQQMIHVGADWWCRDCARNP